MPTDKKFQLDIAAIHNQWCRDNGYPVVERPTFTSAKLQALQASSAKRDATSGCIASKLTPKLQAPSYKLSVKRSVNK